MNLATRAELEAVGQVKHRDELLDEALGQLAAQVDLNGRLLKRIQELSRPCGWCSRNRRAFVYASYVALFWFLVACGLAAWVVMR